MKLETIISNPTSVLPYVERYLNDGSPSGFSTKHTTSNETSPFGLTPWFHPYICIVPKSNVRTYGEIPDYPGENYTNNNNWILIHPDMKENKYFEKSSFKIMRHEYLKTSPTASGRTVQIINNKQNNYVKLHYEGILGRVWRAIPYQKAISGPEITKIIKHSIDEKSLDSRIALLPEIGARVINKKEKGEKNTNEWGMVWRDNIPYCIESNIINFIIPVFSLFSKDRLASYDDLLLKQIIEYKSTDPSNFVIQKLIIPIIDCYFNLILTLGLQPEWNAQNLLIGFDDNFNPFRFVMRDIESIDKDLSIMNYLGINKSFESYPFKCIYDGQYNYQIKHSFMFDYKLGDYIIEPLLIFLQENYNIDIKKGRNVVKDYVKLLLKKLPPDFFPNNGKWYVFDRVLIDQSKPTRPYLSLRNPKYR